MNNNDNPSASQPIPSDTTMPYTYRPLSNELGYPGAALPGAQFANQPGSVAKQAAANYHAEQAQIQQYHQQRNQQDQAKLNAATNRGRKGR